MSSDQITYAFCIETLRYIYRCIGYDNTLNELDFIHSLNSRKAPVESDKKLVQSITQPVVDPVETKSEPGNIIAEDESQDNKKILDVDTIETKNVIVNKPVKKYTRAVVSDELRCEFMMKGDDRCSFRKDKNNKYCGRHANT